MKTNTVHMNSSRLAVLRKLCEVGTYTLYERGGRWYVNLRHEGTQYRLSTGKHSQAEAEKFVAAFRSLSVDMISIDDSHVTRMLERCRYRSKAKGVEFSLLIDDVREIVRRSAGRCEVTGVALRKSGAFKPSIDRIDPKKGYIKSNVRLTCLVANTAMLNYGEDVLLEMAKSMCEKHGVFAARSRAA